MITIMVIFKRLSLKAPTPMSRCGGLLRMKPKPKASCAAGVRTLEILR